MYEFRREDLDRFVDYVHAKTKYHGDELVFEKCPYCKPHSRDNFNTFAINVTNGQFKCLRAGCNAHGNMITLAKDFDFSLGTNVDEYYRPQKKYRTFKKPAKPIEPKPKAIEYLAKRGISEDIAKKYQITVQTNNENILVLPFLNENGDMDFIKYRDTEYSKEKGGNKEWCEKNMKPILFGMYQCLPAKECDTLVLNEGQLDMLSVAESGIPNALSVPTGAKGFTWVPYCWDFINRYKTIIVFGDYEKGEITLVDEIKARFRNLLIKTVRVEDYRDCKDANELLLKYGKDHIRHCIENAEASPIKRVVNLANVKDIDVFQIEKLKTGINELDALLYGGLAFGYLDILSGKRGDGKSCFASQIIANALDQGYNVFAYSGELTNANFKSWIDFQLAGPNNIIENNFPDGSRSWFVTKSNREIISSWYSDRCFLYDSNMIEDDEQEDLIKTIEEVICRNSVRVILIDNLMTALDIDADEGTDKYEKQSRFVKKLVKIALKFNVLILLVAHRRKQSMFNDVNDEVSGSSDITNLAGVVMSYDKDKDVPTDRRLVVSKNRLFGKLNLDGILLSYEEKSKRIFGQRDTLYKDFGWVKQGFIEATDTPFT